MSQCDVNLKINGTFALQKTLTPNAASPSNWVPCFELLD